MTAQAELAFALRALRRHDLLTADGKPALFASAPMKIGKHQWRAVVYFSAAHNKPCSDYEWRRDPDDGWEASREWPSYNFNDGTYGGLPKTLRRIFQRNQEAIESALGYLSCSFQVPAGGGVCTRGRPEQMRKQAAELLRQARSSGFVRLVYRDKTGRQWECYRGAGSYYVPAGTLTLETT